MDGLTSMQRYQQARRDIPVRKDTLARAQQVLPLAPATKLVEYALQRLIADAAGAAGVRDAPDPLSEQEVV